MSHHPANKASVEGLLWFKTGLPPELRISGPVEVPNFEINIGIGG